MSDENINNDNNSNISTLFKEIDKTLKHLGTEKTIQILKNSRNSEGNLSEETLKQAFVLIQIVCDEFEIDLEVFFHQKRTTEKAYIIGISAIVLEKQLNLDGCDIAYVLKKGNDKISLYKKRALELSPKFPFDNKILKKIETINHKIKTLNSYE